jgi:hypothetical protein
MKRIPIKAAKIIADEYGYDQVVVIARRVGEAHEPHGEHVTTYGKDKANCSVAARMGDFFKHKLMGWAAPEEEIKVPQPGERVYESMKVMAQCMLEATGKLDVGLLFATGLEAQKHERQSVS